MTNTRDNPADNNLTSTSRRKVRPEPERDHPFRQASQILGKSNTTAGENAIESSVTSAYKVIENYIADAESIAQRVGSLSYSPLGSSGSAGDLQSRVTEISADLMANWFDLLGTFTNAMLSMGEGTTDQETPVQTKDSTVPKYAVRVFGAERPCAIDLVLEEEATVADVTCPALHSTEHEHMVHAGLETSTSGMLVVHIDLSENPPVGIYSGVLIDRARQAVVGTLRCEIAA